MRILFGLFVMAFSMSAIAVESQGKNPLTAKKLPGQLVKDKIMITDKTYKQVFQAYLGNPCPFITSDSLLNAYHVLYEESICRLEKKQALILKEIVNDLYTRLNDDKIYDNLFFSGKKTLNALLRDKLIIGVAVKLFNPQFKLEDKELNSLAENEVKNVINSSEVIMPKWLGKTSPSFGGIDYSRFKPRGFYCKNETLRRYFMATAWLQAIPFKVDDDDQLIAFLILKLCWKNASSKHMEFENYFQVYDELLGCQDGQGINGSGFYSVSSCGRDDLVSFRKWLMQQKAVQINDSIREAPLAESGIHELRILPARITPDAILFKLTTEKRSSNQNVPVPNGLEIAALLGSEWALTRMSPEVRKIIKQKRSIINKDSCYGLYLNALKSLFDKTEKRLPAFMKNKSWEVKSCNTALAGWAQLRHTWALQAKQNMNYLGLMRHYSGFVEPNYVFWGRMAELCHRTRNILNRGMFLGVSLKDDLALYKRLLVLLKQKDIETIFRNTPEVKQILEPAFCASFLLNKEEDGNDKSSYIKGITKLVNIIETNSLNKYPKLEQMLKSYTFNLDDLWMKLHSSCLILQVISLKQLYDVPRSESEKIFIANYGVTLSKIMLYGGNSYLTPRDDSVRIIDIFSDARNKSGIRYVEVGIGRARELIVLYPTPDGDIICYGAVMPYYEFFNRKRLTDKQWQQLLGAKNLRPDVPEWLAPIIQGGKLGVPNLKSRH